MNSPTFVSRLKDPKSKSCFWTLFPTAALLCLVFFIGSEFITEDHKEKIFKWGLRESVRDAKFNVCQPHSNKVDLSETYQNESSADNHSDKFPASETLQNKSSADAQPDKLPASESNQNKTIVDTYSDKLHASETHQNRSRPCRNRCRPPGSESLPKGIVSSTSNFEMRPLWGLPEKKADSSQSLFSAAVGIKQKSMVDKLVKKFLSSNFAVMLFHYDGIVDAWKDLEWHDSVIHVSAVNQTKWWFAKRFLHPDIVAAYSYIFLWDEDLGVENFNPESYISIVKEERLEISQPALDSSKSEVHHQITARWKKTKVHRRTYKPGDMKTGCDYKSASPPCTGWIEVMSPVFSRAAWRCLWYMLQNDFIHVWGLDMMLGYCAQGDRTKNIGVVDAEYIVHHGLPTLGEPENKASLVAPGINRRIEVRKQSYYEYKLFRRRWTKAVENDKCWTDPYPGSLNYSIF